MSSSSSATSSQAAPFAAGRTRRKALDQRIQSLLHRSPNPSAASVSRLAKSPLSNPSSSSIFAQSQIPMALRKAQAANRVAREGKRRAEARENGVVLERRGGAGASEGAGAGAGRRKKPRREAEVGLPNVGRMRGAELRLSQKDIREMESQTSAGRRGGQLGGRKGPRRSSRR